MIRFENVTKKYGTGAVALSDITLTIDKGEFVFLVGSSGAGKTTFLRLLIRDMLPTDGAIVIGDWDITKLPNNKIPQLRRKIGVVFQDLKLLTDRTIAENIMLPLEMSNMDKNTAKQRVSEILTQVGIIEHALKFPVQLSGGELQRAAIARALVFGPEILLADEPTGNLDITTSWEILKLLQEINKTGTTVVMATHNNEIINSLLKRTITLDKGKVMKDDKKGNESKADTGEEKSKEKKEKAASDAQSEVSDDSVSESPAKEETSEVVSKKQEEESEKKEEKK